MSIYFANKNAWEGKTTALDWIAVQQRWIQPREKSAIHGAKAISCYLTPQTLP
jgi:hypothetical protein